jgi:N-carbamoyl-L-amino-acid hydrolase
MSAARSLDGAQLHGPNAASTPVNGIAPMIDGERLRRSIEEIAQIGALPKGGSCRLALTDEDREARELFADWCRDAGCEVHVDPFGNQFAIRAGRNPQAPLVLFGSHLDTQPNGGRFDGIYGVMAGLEIMRTLQAAGMQTDRSLAIVNWTNEEGVRFSPGLTGSKGFAGLLSAEEISQLKTKEDVSFRDELQRTGFLGAPVSFKVAAYFEAHIEQGPVLETAGLSVGVVTGVQGVRWFDVHVSGGNRHAGTTPMTMRADSFMAASKMVLELRKFALTLSPDIRFTVGRVVVAPGSVNTVPGNTRFSIDLRHAQTTVLDQFERSMSEIAKTCSGSESCTVAIQKTFDLPPILFDPTVIGFVETAAKELDLTTMSLVSGAMHDACALATVAPTAMIFTACRSGISHSEDEFAEPHHLATGCQMLLLAVIAAARAV